MNTMVFMTCPLTKVFVFLRDGRYFRFLFVLDWWILSSPRSLGSGCLREIKLRTQITNQDFSRATVLIRETSKRQKVCLRTIEQSLKEVIVINSWRLALQTCRQIMHWLNQVRSSSKEIDILMPFSASRSVPAVAKITLKWHRLNYSIQK